MQTRQFNEIMTKQLSDFSKPSKCNLLSVALENRIDLAALAPMQRILLTTDGTLTKILEAYLLEKIQLIKLSERLMITTHAIPQLEIGRGSPVLWRRILLQGKTSGRNFVYAEAMLVLDRLTHQFRQELIKSQTSLGNLLLKHRMETFKELLDSSKEPSGKLADYFQIDRQDPLLSRTYRLFCNQHPAMMITEKFPASYFV